ncbi:mCG140271 [Mus musculus]|nr:mCG140271 [Mus musculus]
METERTQLMGLCHPPSGWILLLQLSPSRNTLIHLEYLPDEKTGNQKCSSMACIFVSVLLI